MFEGQKQKRRLEKLIEDWVRYRNLVSNRMGVDNVTPEEELGFLQLKGRIVEQVATLSGDSLPGAGQDVLNQQRGFSEFLNRYTTLDVERPLNEREREEFEREWHRHFLFLNRLKGVRKREGSAKRGGGKAPKAVPVSGVPNVRSGTGHWFVRFALRIVFIVAAIWFVIAIVPWQRITGSSPTVGGVGGFLEGAWSWITGLVTTLRLPTLGGLFDPVVARYGAEATAIMVAALLVALGYWIFVRMK